MARERRLRRLVELGRAEDAVSELEVLVAQHPLRERPLGLLMEALYGTGRQTEALRRYSDYRQRLAEETGLEPSPQLQELELAILTNSLDAAPVPQGSTPDVTFPLTLRPRRFERRPGEPVVYATLGEGPPLLYLPGWISNLEAFAEGIDPRGVLVGRLARDFQVTVFDRYGTGMSRGDGPVDTSFETSVDEGLQVLDRVGEDGVTVFGSSASGPLAVALACASPRVGRVVLLCTYASGPRLFSNHAATASLLGLVRSSWGVGSRVLANLILPGVDAVTSDEFARFQRATAPPEVAAGYLQQMYEADVTDRLPEVDCPALVIHFRHDPAIPFEGARQLSLGLPHSELVVLDGPYHVPPPAFVNQIAEATARFAR